TNSTRCPGPQRARVGSSRRVVDEGHPPGSTHTGGGRANPLGHVRGHSQVPGRPPPGPCPGRRPGPAAAGAAPSALSPHTTTPAPHPPLPPPRSAPAPGGPTPSPPAAALLGGGALPAWLAAPGLLSQTLAQGKKPVEASGGPPQPAAAVLPPAKIDAKQPTA